MILHIFMTTIMPILVMAVAGFVLDRRFQMDLDTLSKINFYIVCPAFLFINTYQYRFSDSTLDLVNLNIVIFVLTLIGVLVLERLLRMTPERAGILRNSILFNNCGNIGVPLIIFIYSNTPYLDVAGSTPWLQAAIAVQIIVFAFQNIVTNSFGFYFAGKGQLSSRDAVKLVFSMPIIYAVILGLGLNQANIDITHLFIWPALENFSNALVMIALFTLGVQLSRTPFQFFKRDVLVASFGRLVMGPGIALVCLWIYMSVLGYDLPAVSAQVMFISAAVPSGVNTALIAAAMHNNADFATQIVVATTVLSAITLPGVIMLANILYAI